MNTDHFGGEVPAPGRRIVWANSDGKIYHLSILEFVVLQCARALISRGYEATVDEVMRLSGPCALALAEDGWFTAQEYQDAIVQDEIANIDEELRRLT